MSSLDGIEIMDEEGQQCFTCPELNPSMTQELSPPLSEQVKTLIRIFTKLFNILGPGYSEKIYETAMGVEFRAENIPYQNQVVIPIYYEKHYVGFHQVDYLVYDNILIEIKAVKWTNYMREGSKSQLSRYLQTTGFMTGMVVNFGSDGVLNTEVVV